MTTAHAFGLGGSSCILQAKEFLLYYMATHRNISEGVEAQGFVKATLCTASTVESYVVHHRPVLRTTNHYVAGSTD